MAQTYEDKGYNGGVVGHGYQLHIAAWGVRQASLWRYDMAEDDGYGMVDYTRVGMILPI